MKIFSNECLNCPPLLPCIGSSCRYYHPLEKHICDKCGDEVTLYYFEDMELCESCLLEKFPIVEGTEW